MSASRWTHAVCLVCWRALCVKQGRENAEPVRLGDDGAVPCCLCGAATDAGIYVRAEPESVPCGGVRGVHVEARP